MNELDRYLDDLTPAQRESFADRCGTSVPYLRQIAAGIRSPKAQLAVTIAKQSRGRVRVERLLPDLDWNYLRRGRNARTKATATA